MRPGMADGLVAAALDGGVSAALVVADVCVTYGATHAHKLYSGLIAL